MQHTCVLRGLAEKRERGVNADQPHGCKDEQPSSAKMVEGGDERHGAGGVDERKKARLCRSAGERIIPGCEASAASTRYASRWKIQMMHPRRELCVAVTRTQPSAATAFSLASTVSTSPVKASTRYFAAVLPTGCTCTRWFISSFHCKWPAHRMPASANIASLARDR